MEYTTGGESAAGDWSAYYQDVAITGANGSGRTLYAREKAITLYAGGQAGSTRGYDVNHYPGAWNPGQWPIVTTTYYHGDHLGSSRQMTAYEGYPVWEATYRPYGEEHAPQPTVNHYKFTGKERDDESNLDYFGARYYASTSARFLSPDEFTGGPVDAFSANDPLPSGPLPYASVGNPQSLNKYSYVWNNPLFFVDPDGHDLYVARSLQPMVDRISRESSTFDKEMNALRENKNIVVFIHQVAPRRQGEPPGDAKGGQSKDNPDVVIMQIRVSVDDDRTLEHETGHANDARTNREQFLEDAETTKRNKGGPNEVPHDERPEEKRANTFKDQVEKERKEYREKQKREKEEKKKEERKPRSGK